MISHVIIISYIALPDARAHFYWASPSPHCSSAAEIFHFRLIRIYSNARIFIFIVWYFVPWAVEALENCVGFVAKLDTRAELFKARLS